MNGRVRKCHNRSLTQQPTSKLTTVVHMVGEQSAYEGNGQRRGKKVALDQSEAYDVAFQKVKITSVRLSVLGISIPLKMLYCR